MNAILIYKSLSQIVEVSYTFYNFINYFNISILSCILMTRQEHVVLLLRIHLQTDLRASDRISVNFFVVVLRFLAVDVHTDKYFKSESEKVSEEIWNWCASK